LRDITWALSEIADGRQRDPLAPVTVVVPSHASGLQLRRRLALGAAYAAVRFETLPRLAELIAAGHLAAEGRSPLARPIGDYVAGEVALESATVFSRVRDLTGYARALRQVFRRLRRGGIRTSSDVGGTASPELVETLRLYDLFRGRTESFYDEEDLLDAAARAVREGRSGVAGELGSIFVVPPGALSAGGSALLEALAASAPGYVELEEGNAAPATRFILAPDPASEAREVVRDVIGALDRGLGVHEVAVFHGADAAYTRLLREAFDAAKVPSVALPGVPLSESAIGRAVLTLVRLPPEDYPRTHAMDFFALTAVKDWIPAGSDRARTSQPAWDRVSRAAGITKGQERWREGLRTYANDLESEIAERAGDARERRLRFERDKTTELAAVIEELISRLEPLKERQAAAEFIEDFASVVDAYVSPDAEGYEDVLREIGQLGTVDAIGGSFDLSSFGEAIRANLDAGILKERRARLGEGVLVGRYQAAAGLGFKHVVLCGAYEGAFPASSGTDPLIDDVTWARLREEHPFVEDSELRNRRSSEAAQRAVNSAGDGTATWSCPVYEPGATRDYYPSPMMVRAASDRDPEITTATRLRGLPAREWLRRSPSPLGTMLEQGASEPGEVTLRQAVSLRKSGRSVDTNHPLARNVEMLRARRSRRFTEWDGNLVTLSPADWLAVRPSVGPTTLETYARCGFRYFARNILRLNAPEEPEERELMGSADRGTLVHRVLERFYTEVQAAGRPKPYETWQASDRNRLLAILEEELEEARKRGRTGRAVFLGRETQLLRADLMRFLDIDDEFRATTGAVPAEFEASLSGYEVGGISFWGKVDRIDRTTDGRKAWIIDYKTGTTSEFEGMKGQDQLAGGTHLQLPAYLGAARDAEEVTALYWFITHRGGFERIEFENTRENVERFHAAVKAIVDGVRAGAFPAVSGDLNEFRKDWENCRFCDYRRLCSRSRDHQFSAKSGDEAMNPWHTVAAVAQPDGAEE
jgi:hypothetical protein